MIPADKAARRLMGPPLQQARNMADMAAFFNAAPALGSRLAAAGCKPASTLLGVASLFHPEIMVGIEATAVA